MKTVFHVTYFENGQEPLHLATESASDLPESLEGWAQDSPENGEVRYLPDEDGVLACECEHVMEQEPVAV